MWSVSAALRLCAWCAIKRWLAGQWWLIGSRCFCSRPCCYLEPPILFWKSLGLMLLPFLLIMKEPDLGSALVLLPAGLAIMFAAGTPKRYLVWLGAGVGVLAALFLVDVDRKSV